MTKEAPLSHRKMKAFQHIGLDQLDTHVKKIKKLDLTSQQKFQVDCRSKGEK